VSDFTFGFSWRIFSSLLSLGLVEHVGESTLATVLPVEVSSHEDTGSTFLGSTLTPQTVDLAVVINLVVFEYGELDLLMLVLDLLGGGVVLLLPLLATTPESEHKVEGGLLLDVVVGQGSAVLELFTSEDQSLLVWGDSLLVLDFSLDVLDGVRWLNLQSDGLPGQGLDEDLHTSPQSENKMEGGLLLDVIVGQGSAVLELLASEDKPLLVWGDSLLVLDFGLDVLDGVRWLDFQSDGLPGQGLDEDLHASPQSENKMEGGLLLDVVIGQGSTVLELFSCEDQPLLVWGDPLLVLDLGLDVLDGIAGLDLKGDGLPGQGFHENLHLLY